MTVLDKLLSSDAKHPALVMVPTEGQSQVTSRFELDQEIVSLGRATENGICLNDSNISKRHCLLVRTPQGVKVVDLESTNGCYVNDHQVKEQALRDGDTLRVGPFHFRFTAGRFVPPAAPVLPGEAAVGRPFADVLMHEVRRTPFWLVSGIVHLILVLLLWKADFLERPPGRRAVRITATPQAEVDDFVEEELEEVEEDVPETDLSLEVEEGDITDVVTPAKADASEAEAEDGPDAMIGLTGRMRGGLNTKGQLFDAGRLAGALAGTKLQAHVEALRGRGLDVCIVFDSTGSMQGFIDGVKAQINQMNTYIGALVGDYRLAMVTYRDNDDAYLTKHERFTTDYYRILNFVERVNASGGDDIPEAVFDGLKVAIDRLRWRKKAFKVVLLFGDAPPHARQVQACLSLAGRFSRRNGRIHTIYTDVGASEGALDSDGKKAVAAFRSIARYGGGEFSFIDQESQIVQALQTMIFGKEYAKDVEKVRAQLDFGWRGRHIRKKIKKRDAKWLLKMFVSRDRVHPLIVEGLIEVRHPSIESTLSDLRSEGGLSQAKSSAIEFILRKKGVDVR